MELTQVRTFMYTVMHGSFSRAAVALGVTQSSVSARVASLEAELGTVLLIRRGSGVQPTAAGTKLLEYADQLIALASEAVTSVSGTRGGLALRIGANNTSSTAVVSTLIGESRRSTRERQDAQVDLLVEGTAFLMPPLMEGEIELAFVSPELAYPACQVLWSYSSPVVLVAAPGHRLAGEIVAPDDLRVERFLAFRMGPAAHATERLSIEVGSPINVVMRSNDNGLVAAATAAGEGISLLPRVCVEHMIDDGSLVELATKGLKSFSWESVLVKWRDRALSEEAVALVEVARRYRDSHYV